MDHTSEGSSSSRIRTLPEQGDGAPWAAREDADETQARHEAGPQDRRLGSGEDDEERHGADAGDQAADAGSRSSIVNASTGASTIATFWPEATSRWLRPTARKSRSSPGSRCASSPSASPASRPASRAGNTPLDRATDDLGRPASRAGTGSRRRSEPAHVRGPSAGDHAATQGLVANSPGSGSSASPPRARGPRGRRAAADPPSTSTRLAHRHATPVPRHASRSNVTDQP